MAHKRLVQDRLPRGQRQRLLMRLLRRPGEAHLRRLLARVHPADIAPLFALLNTGEQERLLELLFELRLAGPTLRELDTERQIQALDTLPDNRLAVILTRLSADDAVDLLGLVNEERRQRVLGLLDPHRATRLDYLNRFGDATAGGMMDPDVSSFQVDSTVGETLAQIRRMAGSGRLFYVYVTDPRGHLMGIVNLWQLVVSNDEKRLREIMSDGVVSVGVETPREEVARVFSRYDLLLVPVIDHEGRLVGVITVDDVLDVVEEEATEDLYRLVNLDPQEGVATPALRAIRLRLPGLAVNLASALLGAAVILPFLDTVSRLVLLAAVLPLVTSLGRSTGNQTLAVVVRSLARGEMDLRRPLGVLARQLTVGAATGLFTGVLVGGLVALWEGSLLLGGILGLALTVNQTLAALLGTAVPLLLSRLRLDPSLLSSTAVATASQVIGFLVLLGSASLLLGALT